VLINYDALGTFGSQGTTGGVFGEARLFGPYGVLSSTAITLFSPTANQQEFTRLDTSWTYSEPDDFRQWRAGDLISGAVGWSRPVRIGGAQLNTNFDLRPDLVTYPIPLISSSVTVPSTVDVMINNVRQFTQPVQPGPFELRNLPMTSGAGQAVVQTTDALGRQALLTVPFYVAPQLLAVGLSNYSVEAGPVRQNYNQPGDGYSSWAASGSLRHGVTDWLTLETHAEATAQLVTAGAGVATRIGHLGTASVAVAGSSGRGNPTPAQAPGKAGASGGLISASVERTTSKYTIGFSMNLASAGYRDIAATFGTPVPSAQIRASLSMPIGEYARYGSASMSYLEQRTHATSPIQYLSSSLTPVDYSGSSYSMLMANYSLGFLERFTFYAVGYKDVRTAHTAGILFGVSVYLGNSIQAGATAGSDSGRSSYSASIQRNSSDTQDYSYSMMDREGFQPRRTATVDYRDTLADLTAGIDQTSGTTYKRAGVSGSIVLMDSSLKMSNQIDNSFALVKTGTTGQIPVYFENRYMGTTDSGGSLLLPYLRSYQRNQISIDVKELPPDVQVGATRKVVPAYQPIDPLA
jgi:outer membrane usher protein